MQIGLIGAGMMGQGMAANLLKHGHEVTVIAHRNRAPIEALIAEVDVGGSEEFGAEFGLQSPVLFQRGLAAVNSTTAREGSRCSCSLIFTQS